MEDSKILSLSCWNREQSILQFNINILDIQKALYFKTQISSKIDEFVQSVLDVASKEIGRSDIEMRTINRYHYVKVDTLYQKQVMFNVLEQIFENYKKLTFLYEAKLTIVELATLKTDLSRFKTELRQHIYVRGATVAEVLTLVSQCSKGRLDRALELANRNANIWRDLFSKQAEIKLTKLKINNQITTYEDQGPMSPKQLILCLSGYRINKLNVYPQVNSHPQTSIYPLIKSERVTQIKSKSSLSFERGKSNIIKNLKQLNQKTQSSVHLNFKQIPSSSRTILIPKKQLQYTKYTESKSPRYTIPVYLGSYKSDKDTLVPDNPYWHVWNDSRPNNNDLINNINREYKELFKANQQINQGIDQYLKNTSIYSKKQKESQNTNPLQISNCQMTINDLYRAAIKLVPILDIKEILRFRRPEISNDTKRKSTNHQNQNSPHFRHSISPDRQI